MKSERKKHKNGRTTEKSTASRTKEEALKEVGKGFAKGVKPEDRLQSKEKRIIRRVLVDKLKNTKVEIYEGDQRSDEEVIADFEKKYKTKKL